MSFLGKIGAIAAAVAVGGGLVYWAYNSYQKEQEEIVEEVEVAAAAPKEKLIDIRVELAKLKLEINTANPSLEDIKRIFTLLTSYLKQKTVALSNMFKQNRRKLFPKESRFDRLPEYMRHSFEGIMQLQNAVMQLQNEQGQLLGSIGLTQAKLAQFGPQLAPFMQELILNSDISLDQVKLHLQLKADYLRDHGERIVAALVEIAASLSLQEKQFIPMFLNIVISDECFEHQPNLDKDEFDIAAEKYKDEITNELVTLEQVLMPLMGKLQTALVGDDMGGYGGAYGGYGDYDQMDMGGMGGMGMSEEAMHQQLQAIRQQDPQAYEQLMAMMQAQMGR